LITVGHANDAVCGSCLGKSLLNSLRWRAAGKRVETAAHKARQTVCSGSERAAAAQRGASALRCGARSSCRAPSSLAYPSSAALLHTPHGSQCANATLGWQNTLMFTVKSFAPPPSLIPSHVDRPSSPRVTSHRSHHSRRRR